MKRAFWVFAAALLLTSPSYAGMKTLLGVGNPPAAAAGGYTGPGDIVASALGWWGLRGYSAAYSTGSNPAVDLVDQAGANSITINILSTGALDVASISTWVTAHSVTTIRVSKLYDQSGNGVHASVAASNAVRPTLTLNGIGSLPIMSLTGAISNGLDSVGTISQSQSWTVSAIGKRTGNNTLYGSLFGSEAGGQEYFVGFGNGTNTGVIYAGSVYKPALSVTDGSFHAMQYIANGASSVLYADGTAASSGSANTGALSGIIHIGWAGATLDEALTGDFMEVGVWAGDQSASNAALNTNQHTYWGF